MRILKGSLNEDHGQCEIYTIASHTWRSSGYVPIPDQYFLDNINGDFYWSVSEFPHWICEFKIGTVEFQHIRPPPLLDNWRRCHPLELQVIDNCLEL